MPLECGKTQNMCVFLVFPASYLEIFFTQNSVINQICYTGFASVFWSMHMHKINAIPASMSVNEHGKL